MNHHWIFKTDPSTYSFQNLLDERKVTWKQVKNIIALKELRNVKQGDVIMIYHTNEDQIVGIAEALTDPYKDDASADNGYQIDLRAIKKLTRPVPLWEIKSNNKLKDIDLVNIPELNIDSIDKKAWDKIMMLAKERVK